MTQNILAITSLGELIDNITILQIKTQQPQGSALENIKKELIALETTLISLPLNVDPKHFQNLKDVNKEL